MTKRKLIRKQRIVKKKEKKNTSKKTKELNNSGINLDAPEVYAPPLIPVMLFSSQIQWQVIDEKIMGLGLQQTEYTFLSLFICDTDIH